MSDIYMRILLSASQGNSVSAIKNVTKELGGGGGGLLGAVKSASSALSGGVGGGMAGGMGAVSGMAGPMVGALVAIGTAAIGLGVKSVKMAGDFQQQMTTLVTGAGEAQGNLKMVSAGILKMAVDTGTTTKQLTDGMFMIESSGAHGADGLNVLAAAAKGAKVGNADLGVTANALTTILTDYHLKSSDAAKAMNALTVTVSSGKTHLQDLASAMGSVLPLASSLGVSFPNVAGAIATMTNAGMSAQRASQNLANTLRSLSAPGGAAQKAMTAVGISAQDLKDTLTRKGLPAALQMIEQHVGKTFPAGSVEAVQAYKHILGGATGYNVALMLGGKNMAGYQANVDAITKAMQTQGDAIQGWSLVQQDLNFRLDQAKEVIQTLGIKIGTKLLPVVTTFVGWFVDGMQRVMDALGQVGAYFKKFDLSGITYAWHQLSEAVAKLLKPLTDAGHAMQVFAPYLTAMRNEISQLIDAGIRDIAAFITNIAHAVEGLNKGGGGKAFSGLTSALKYLEPPLRTIVTLIKNEVLREFHDLQALVQQVAGWFMSSVVPALKDAAKGFLTLAHTVLDTVIPAFIKIRGITMDVTEHAFKTFGPHIEALIPKLIRFAGVLANDLSQGIKVVTPMVVTLFQGLGNFAMLVQDQIIPSLKAVGGFLGGVFAPIWQQIVDMVNNEIKPAWNDMLKTITPLLPQLKLFAQFLGGVVLVALIMVAGSAAGLVKGLAGLFSGVVMMIGGFIKFFAGLVQMISGIIAFVVDLCTGQFGKLGGDLSAIGGGWVKMFQGLAQSIGGIFVGLWRAITGVVSGMYSTVTGMFQSLYDHLVGHSIVPDMINGIVSWIGQLPGRAMNFIGSFVSQAAGALGSLGGKALQWGSDMISGFTQGIRNAVGGVQDAIGGVASWISSHLHFSVPDKGPLATANRWMPDMMELFASSLRAAAPVLQGAINTSVLAPLARAASPDSGVLADQLSFAQEPTEIFSGKRHSVDTKAERHREVAQKQQAHHAQVAQRHAQQTHVKAARHTVADEFKSVDAEIKVLEEREKHLHKGAAKTALQREIKADKAREKKLKQEIHLNLTIHAHKADASEVDRIAEEAVRIFGDKIRAQFGNI